MNQKLPVHGTQSEDTIDALKTRVIELESVALATFHKLANERKRVAELEARILMMATVENNLRGGLKQLDDIKYNLEEDIQVLKEELQYERMTPMQRTEYIALTNEAES